MSNVNNVRDYAIYIAPKTSCGDDILVDLAAHSEIGEPSIGWFVTGVTWSYAVEKIKGLYLTPSDKLDLIDGFLKDGHL